MKVSRLLNVGPRAGLAGDGALIMAAACAVLAPLSSLAEGATFPLMAVGLLAPLLAWRLHRRAVDGPATIGAVFSYLAGVMCALALLMVLAVLGLLLSLLGMPSITDGSGSGGPIYAGVVAAALLVLALWLDVDALRDLLAKQEHVWLDVTRIVATVAVVAYSFGAFVYAAAHPEFDYIGAILSIGGCGVVGAVVVAVADLWVRRHQHQADGSGRLLSGV